LQGSAGIWDMMADWAVTNRAYSKSIDISPDGGRVYHYRCDNNYGTTLEQKGGWCDTASISTSTGSFVTISATMIALYREEYDPAGGHDYDDYSYIKQVRGVVGNNITLVDGMNPLNPGGTNINPIPYWRSDANLCRGTYPGPFQDPTSYIPQTGLETIEWSIDIGNNHTILYTCNGTRFPTALLMGPITIGGSVTLYNENGVFDPILGPDGVSGTLTNPYLYAENTWFQVRIHNGTNYQYIEVPAVVVEADDYGITGADAVTQRGFTIKGLGGRTDAGLGLTLAPCVISKADGSFDTPKTNP